MLLFTVGISVLHSNPWLRVAFSFFSDKKNVAHGRRCVDHWKPAHRKPAGKLRFSHCSSAYFLLLGKRLLRFVAEAPVLLLFTKLFCLSFY